ncbi:MAG: aspartate--tRNA ligase [Candidatus Latescibacteria bacterium]|nr:aspartate--tRNA ligase [Candidatus Latescibacterota bacterium]
MHAYRTHTCGALRPEHSGEQVRLSGWVHRVRDHGGLRFVDLRDHYGMTQLVFAPDNEGGGLETRLNREAVIRVDGRVAQRPREAANEAMTTGQVEVQVERLQVLNPAAPLPFPVAEEQAVADSLRNQYRFLDLRRTSVHRRMELRSRVTTHLRRRLGEMGFAEYNTPLLTSSSPEGARDFLVPSRLHPGQFYALPQAPQQFKQLLMIAGFDRYFQIAPCFRDEDPRADRAPEFYQLDLEMAFVDQEEIFAVVEELLSELFAKFGCKRLAGASFVRLTYAEAMRRYGTDKPDLRFGLEIEDVSELCAQSELRLFRQIVQEGGVVRGLCVPGLGQQPRAVVDGLVRWVQQQGGRGLAYVRWQGDQVSGSVAGAMGPEAVAQLRQRAGAVEDPAWLLIADREERASLLAGQLRLQLAELLALREPDTYRFCWVVDFPLFEWNQERGAPQFAHNPFSMPQGGLEALESQDPLDILAYQYDIVCNGLELSSGAIRNHQPEVQRRAFAVAGYSQDQVEQRFGGLLRALSYGAPPHGGIAPGLDRIVMLLAGANNIRECIPFPTNLSGRDLLMGAPGRVEEGQLEELHIDWAEGVDVS